MKRLVTLGITLALVMGLFCFSVNAENIVIQGESDTVTATYGSNDVTIALRARKLRVINTGTAAAGYAGYTPVIVSITIYNLGNQNCLVNNLKFRLTSESAEYRIAGFENISPDLFISDTAYDATGYLSLKASNDYTYAGGFVVPANSNMTYVGIINVSANWITENQTWRTVDLSTATFYDNVTTTVGDYTCAAEPVDLSDIESSINSIVTSLQGIDLDNSTYLPLLRDILNNIVYSGPHYQFSSNNFSSSQVTHSISGIDITVQRTIGRAYLSEYSVVADPSNDTEIVSGTVRYPFYLFISIRNDSGNVLEVNGTHTINNALPNNCAANINITTLYSNYYDRLAISGPNILLYNKFPKTSSGNYSYMPQGRLNAVLIGYIEKDINQSVSFSDMSINTSFIYSVATSTYNYLPINEYFILRDLYLAYSSVNGTGDLSDQANEAAEQAENIHNQEASYYAQNQAAIEATGLSNFQFSGEQSNGIGAVSNDFTALWNAIGSWNSVYIFSMTLTLALTILRHMPNRRRPKEDKKE